MPIPLVMQKSRSRGLGCAACADRHLQVKLPLKRHGHQTSSLCFSPSLNHRLDLSPDKMAALNWDSKPANLLSTGSSALCRQAEATPVVILATTCPSLTTSSKLSATLTSPQGLGIHAICLYPEFSLVECAQSCGVTSSYLQLRMMIQLQGYVGDMIVRMPWSRETSEILVQELQLEARQNGQGKGSVRWIIVSFSGLGISSE